MALNQIQAGPIQPKQNGTITAAGGYQGETVVASLHAEHYLQALGGNVFHATTATAGTTIPVQATNLVSTFTILNPRGSGKNLVLVRYTLGTLNATVVVSDVSLYYQADVGGVNTALATTTALAVKSNILNGTAGSSVALAYSAATFANTMGTNMFKGPTLGSFGAVTTTNPLPIDYLFRGSIIVPPGTAVTTAGNAAQTQAHSQFMSWVETPI